MCFCQSPGRRVEAREWCFGKVGETLNSLCFHSAGDVEEEEDKDAQSAVALSITDNDSVASPERIIARGTYKATHKKGLFHAHSNDFGRSSNDDDGFVDFHTMIVSDANSIASNEQASVGASIKKSEVEMTNMKVT